MQTPMARSSGVVGNVPPATFQAAGLEYSVAGNSFSFRYQGETIHRRLDYYIGAGVTGRSYLTSIDGFLFQAPISWYASTSQWDLSPGYESQNEPNLVRAVEPSCLNCHASGVLSRGGTVNGYERPPFIEAGVSCERCHVNSELHATSFKSGKLVRPKPVRSSVCEQCHLPGVVTIGSSVFVWDGLARESTVNGHFEQLARSRCARASGGKLWCGSCHNPHGEQNYRQLCMRCHTPASCTATNRTSEDCIGCHMPRISAQTVQHAAITDHTIPRRPPASRPSDVPEDAKLRLFGGGEPASRELGLAYAAIALRDNNRIWGQRALDLLEKVPADAKVLTQLAQLVERRGQQQRACDLYARAVAADPAPVAAAINLGTCYAEKGELDKSIGLWRAALSRIPGLDAARSNLAVALFRSGRVAAAHEVLTEGLKFNPASARTRQLLQEMSR
jgi:hypothetical protein